MNVFERAGEIFEELAPLSGEGREVALARYAGEGADVLKLVRQLLDGEDRARTGLDRPAVQLGAAGAPRPERPTRIGSYEINGVLGEGGMGVVYEAVQESPRRTVALKLVRPGFVSEAVLRRFQHEAEVLGWLNHPGIAHVFDAGTASTASGEQPYIAMELVRGERIDRYAESAKLTIDERLLLVAGLCDAVHHAHQKGLVHRDLKPANVLVTEEGQLKVLDFGIARITAADVASTIDATRTGEVLGTLPYMSPEQIGADPSQVDTRTDVYALGAIAYELLTGERPLDLTGCSLPEAARAISEDEPTTLGVLDRRLGGDIELIVGRALAKEKERRYASAEELARDIRRYLADEPIEARAPSRAHQLRKFARRNKGLVAGMALTFAVLLAAAFVATRLYFQNSTLLVEKEVEVRAADEAVLFLEGLFEQTDPFAEEQLTVRQVTERAAQRIDGEFRDSPRLRARLLSVLGKAFNHLGLGQHGVPLLEEALGIRRAEFGEDSLEYVETLERLARARIFLEVPEDAEAGYRQVLAVRRARLGDHVLTADTLVNLSGAVSTKDRAGEALAFAQEALEMIERVLDADDPRVAAKRHVLANRFFEQGRYDEAEALLRQLTASEDVDIAGLAIDSRDVLARILRQQQRFDEAEVLSREAYRRGRERYGSDSHSVHRLQRSLASLLSNMGQVDESVALMRDLYERVIVDHGEETIEAAVTAHDLAFALHELPDKSEAEEYYYAALECFEQVLGPDNPGVFQTQHNLSTLFSETGRFEEADDMARKALAGRVRVLGASDVQTLYSWRGVASNLERWASRNQDAEMRRILREEAAGTRRKVLGFVLAAQGESSNRTQNARIDLATVLIDLRAFEEAEPLLLAVRENLDGLAEPERVARSSAEELGRLYRAAGRNEEAGHWARVLLGRD
jgi:tetratricopeptide (TPR) repeat protein